MPALTENDKKLLEKGLAGMQILACTAARLYEAEDPRKYSHTTTGALALCYSKGTFVILIYDLQASFVRWKYSLSGDINYKDDRPWFHSFVGKAHMIGLSFADEADAAEFKDKVLNRESLKKPEPAQVTPPAAPTESSENISRLSTASKEQGSGGLLSFGRKSTKKGKIDKSMISGPSDFQHVSHVGFSTKTGYNVQNIPPEWKVIFQKAGITDEQLQDKEQMKVVKRFMKQNAALVKQQAEAEATTAQPTTRRAPPPPPPSRSSVSAKVAPAPPAPVPNRASMVPPRPSPAIPQSSPAPPIPSRAPAIPERAAPSIPERGAPPSIPERTKPTIPNRAAVPPPVPQTQSVSNGAPPPPPPPGPPAPIPPSTPPPTKLGRANTVSATPTPPSDLLSQIRGGAALKSVDAPRSQSIVAAPTDLLSEIRQGKSLKATSLEPKQEAPPLTGGDDLADALRNALQKRSNALAGSDSESEEDEDSEW